MQVGLVVVKNQQLGRFGLCHLSHDFRTDRTPGAGDKNPPSEKEFMDGFKIRYHLLPTEQVLDFEVTDVSKSDVAPHKFGNAAQYAQWNLGRLGQVGRSAHQIGWRIGHREHRLVDG
jgi:hypothetical protein